MSLNAILSHINQSSNSIALYGLRGSSKALLLALLAQSQQRPLVIVASSFEQAEALIENLRWFLDPEKVFFFPHWDTLPYDNFSPHKSLVAQRFRALNALVKADFQCVVTTPNALMQRVVPQGLFQKHTLTLKVGACHERSYLMQRLNFAGYTEVDVVEDQGEYSTHGDILDIFPISESAPLRLHWDHDQLKAIDAFEVRSQQTSDESDSESSHTDTLYELEILPAQEVLLTPESVNCARRSLRKYKKNISAVLYNQFSSLLNEAQIFPGIESILPLFYTQTETLFDFIPSHALLVTDESDEVQKHAEHFYNEIFMEYELGQKQGNLVLPPESLYLNYQDVQSYFKKHSHLSCSKNIPEQQSEFFSYTLPFVDNLRLRSEFEQTHSTSALGHVVQQIQSWVSSNIPVLIHAKNQTHADHVKQLLGDLGVQTLLAHEGITPLSPQNLPWMQWLEPGTRAATQGSSFFDAIPIVTGALSSGFRMLSDAGKPCFVLLTEEEIFGKKVRNRRLQRSEIKELVGSLEDLKEGDYVVHLEYGIGKYLGLQKISHGSQPGSGQDFMMLSYARNEKVYVPVSKFHLIQKYISEGSAPKLHKLGDKAWTRSRSKVAKAVEDIADELTEIYAARKAQKGHAFPADDSEMQEFEMNFAYEETPDQERVIQEVKTDMESTLPMDRLVCGDVGFGKTEVAMRASFKAAYAGKQVAVLVPTTILAQQHHLSFLKRFADTPLVVKSLSRFNSTTEQKQVIRDLKDGKIDILIGTHRLLSADVKFKDLGLLVVDEEQRFGVRHKEKIKRFRSQVDILTLSATPIPRTLHMSLLGIRDLSIINTPPADRRAIRTRLLKSSDYIIQEAVSREIRRGGQVYMVHNRVETIHEYGRYLQGILPNVRIAITHGQMPEQQLEHLMLDFMDGEYDVLLATTIIESGLDIPRTNTILINNADRFGLSQLYQLRGRVGRSNVQAYAYLLVPADKMLTSIAQERLRVLQELNDLGAGFKVASRDLELRGAGNLLGSKQSGHIASVGLELYTQMIEQAVQKRNKSQSELIPLEEIQLKVPWEMDIPEDYIRSTNQRLSLYKGLASVSTEEDLWTLRNGIENRFGMMPEALLHLFKGTELRLIGQELGLASIEYQQQKLRVKLGKHVKPAPEALIAWLSEAKSPLRFTPENILDLKPVAADIDTVLRAVRSFERLFQKEFH